MLINLIDKIDNLCEQKELNYGKLLQMVLLELKKELLLYLMRSTGLTTIIKVVLLKKI
jgi:hypothetical protein